MADYDFNLVFEGGGAKGLVFVGAIAEFEAQGYTYGRLLGTSAGAITATLLAAGFTATELLDAVNEKLPNGKARFSTFMDVPNNFTKDDIQESLTYQIFQAIDLPFVPDRVEKKIDKKLMDSMMQVGIYRQIFSFIERGGLYAGDAFTQWMAEKLNQNDRNLGGTTLEEFNQRTSKDVTVVASDTTAGKILVLNHRTAPKCPIVAAVRMSMSIPFLWQEVEWQEEWGLYRGEDISGHAVVDGGVLSNFPIELLISRDKGVLEMMGPHDGVFAVGMLIDEELSVKGLAEIIAKETADNDGFDLVNIDVKGLATTQRVTRLVNTMLRGHDKLVIDAYSDGVVRLPAKGYATTDFDLSTARIDCLIGAGREQMKEFLAKLKPYIDEHHSEKLREKESK